MLPGKTYSAYDVLGVVRRRWWLLPVPLATLFLALVVSSRLVNVYQAQMLIAIVPQRVPNEYVRSTVTLRTQERLNAITVEITSRSVLEPMITDLNLYPEMRARAPMEAVVEHMRDNIDVGVQKQESTERIEPEPTAFHVRFSYPDAAVAASVTERLGSTYIERNSRDRGSLAKATDTFLETQLEETRQRLEVQEAVVKAFREKHGDALPSQLQSNLTAVQSTQLQIQTLVEGIARDRDRKLMLERLYQEARNEQIVYARPAGADAGAAPRAGEPAASFRQQLAAARVSLLALEGRLTEEHPDVIRARQSVAELEAKAAAEATARRQDTAGEPPVSPEEALRRESVRTLRAEIESLDRQLQFKEAEERRFRAVAAEYQRRIESVPRVESEWVVLTRDYETQKSAYEDLLKKREASKVALNLENQQIGEIFRMVDPARVPVKPIRPKRAQISAIGLVLGFVLAIGIGVALEVKDATFRTESELADLFRLQVLATVPYIETRRNKRWRRSRRLAAAAAAITITTGAAFVFWALRLWTVIV